MKRLITSLLAALTLTACLGASKFPTFILSSVRPLTYTQEDHTTNVCTTFSVNKEQGWWMTAGHCLHPGVEFDGRPLEVIAADSGLDLGVISGPHTSALALAIKAPEVGDDITSVGYPQGSLDPLVAFGRLSSKRARVSSDQTFQVTHGDSGPGSSGGPVLDSSGRVVCLTQAGNGLYRGCTPFKEFKEFVEKFFER